MSILVEKSDGTYYLTLYIGEKTIRQLLAKNYTFLANGRVKFYTGDIDILNVDQSVVAFIKC